MKKVILLLMALVLLTGCTASPVASSDPSQIAGSPVTKEIDVTFTDRELAGTWDARKAVTITGSGDTFRAGGKGVSLTDGQVLISREGVYILTGTFTDLPIVVRAGEQDKVQLVLDSAEITSQNGPAILVESADKVFITLPAGTESRICDGPSYLLTDTGSPDAAIFSRADLCLNGSGALTVSGNYRHGVVSKDDLIIAGCTLRVTAASTALDGKDCVKVTGATITIDAGTNGVRSDNTEDNDRGFVYLTDSALSIVSGGDGVQAATMLQAVNVHMTVTAGGGNGYSLRSADGSWKGLKSGGDMLLDGGEYVISSRDDCIHANGSIAIVSGTFNLASGDDGIHADSELTVSGGNILISQSYEGLEASKLVIAGGRLDITASDDGLNAAGGADGSSMGGRFGRGMFSNGVGEIIISGGYTVINASGDGIDSNNTITVSGGVTLVSGPTSGANGAFDYDGNATVTGGVLIATGASGMAQNFSDAQTQGAMLVTFGRRQTGAIALTDADGRVVVAFTPETAYQSAVITAPGILQGQTYTIVTGGVAEGSDENGFILDTTLTGGTTLGTITMTELLYGAGPVVAVPAVADGGAGKEAMS